MTTRMTGRIVTRPATGTNGLKRSALLMATAVLLTCGVESARADIVYWWGTTSANWSEDNWGSNDNVATRTPDTPVAGDSLRWYYSATSNTTSNNDIDGLSVGLIDFRRAPSAITLDGKPLTITGNVAYGSGHIINLELVANVAYLNLQMNGTSALTINGDISETGGSRNVSASGGPLNLNGANSFTGRLTVQSTTTINTLANDDTAQSMGQGLLQFGSGPTDGTVIYTGGATSTDKTFQIGRHHVSTNLGGGSFINNGSGAVVWTGPQQLATSIDSARTFTLGGDNTDNNDWQSAIADNEEDCPIAIAKEGEGKWILSGTNTYTNGTTVSEGTLLVNNTSGSGVGTGDVVINGGTLGGTGTIGLDSDPANISFGITGGTIAPGASPGILTVYGDVDFTSDGSTTFSVEIDGPTVGDDYDQLVVVGGVILDESTVLDLTWNYTPVPGDTFTLISATGGITGNFAGLLDGDQGLANGMTWQIAYDGAGISLSVMLVPRPASAGLLALAGILALRRRRG